MESFSVCWRMRLGEGSSRVFEAIGESRCKKWNSDQTACIGPGHVYPYKNFGLGHVAEFGSRQQDGAAQAQEFGQVGSIALLLDPLAGFLGKRPGFGKVAAFGKRRGDDDVEADGEELEAGGVEFLEVALQGGDTGFDIAAAYRKLGLEGVAHMEIGAGRMGFGTRDEPVQMFFGEIEIADPEKRCHCIDDDCESDGMAHER